MKDIKAGDATQRLKGVDELKGNLSITEKLLFIKQNYEEIVQKLLGIDDNQKLSIAEKADYELLNMVDNRDRELENRGNVIVEFSKFCHGNHHKIHAKTKGELVGIHRATDLIVTNQKGEILVNSDADVGVHNKHVKAGHGYRDVIRGALDIDRQSLNDINMQDFLKYIINNDYQTQFTKAIEVRCKENFTGIEQLPGEFVPISEIEDMVVQGFKQGEHNRLQDLIFIKYLKFRSNKSNKGIKEIEDTIKRKNDTDLRFIEDKTRF